MKDNTMYALLEQGGIHTDGLTQSEANEMLERHTRFFPDIDWQIVPMSETEGREKLIGLMERQRLAYIRNSD